MGVIVISWEYVGAPERTLGAPGSVAGNHKQTLRDAWDLMDIYSEGCRRYLRLFGCT